MIHNHLPYYENAYWGVSRSTHIESLGDTPEDRVKGNSVLLQLQNEDPNGYARQALTVDGALLVASFLTGAVTSILAPNALPFEATYGSPQIEVVDGRVRLTVVDNCVMRDNVVSLDLMPRDASEIASRLISAASDLYGRITSGLL